MGAHVDLQPELFEQNVPSVKTKMLAGALQSVFFHEVFDEGKR